MIRARWKQRLGPAHRSRDSSAIEGNSRATAVALSDRSQALA
jgi:hypothetical protein